MNVLHIMYFEYNLFKCISWIAYRLNKLFTVSDSQDQYTQFCCCYKANNSPQNTPQDILPALECTVTGTGVRIPFKTRTWRSAQKINES